MRILLTGGGTAGHAWPVVLVGQRLMKNRRLQILYVGSCRGIEKELAAQFHIPFKGIAVGKRRAYFSLANFWDIFKICFGIIQSFFIILCFRPKAVFAKGGYVTVPIIFWLRYFRIPLVIHESDVVMGRANFWVSKIAKKICLGFPVEYYRQNLPLDKLVYTGIPVHPDFMKLTVRSGERPKILITGGSQGSSKINDLVKEILPSLLVKYEIWHLMGKRDFSKVSYRHQYYHSLEFTYEMASLMREADLIISRAGANTLAEISAAGKPAIIIPLPTAAAEHQTANARVYLERNAAVVVSEEKLTANSLLSIINNLMADEPMRRLLGHHARGLFQKEATTEIVDTIFTAAK